MEDWLTGRPVATRSGGNAGGTGQTYTGVVVRADEESGVWVVPIGGDRRHPIGPCYGGRRRVDGGGGVLELIPVETVVLLVTTDNGAWIAAWEEG